MVLSIGMYIPVGCELDSHRISKSIKKTEFSIGNQHDLRQSYRIFIIFFLVEIIIPLIGNIVPP